MEGARQQPPDLTLATVEREHILGVLALNNWHLGRTAAVLGVATKTVYNRLHAYEKQGFVVRTPAGWRPAPPPAGAQQPGAAS